MKWDGDGRGHWDELVWFTYYFVLDYDYTKAVVSGGWGVLEGVDSVRYEMSTAEIHKVRLHAVYTPWRQNPWAPLEYSYFLQPWFTHENSSTETGKIDSID